MNLHEYLSERGRGAIGELAILIGSHAPDVSRWASGKRVVPEKAAVAIERETAGAVTRRDLRPNDWHLIWPELEKTESNPCQTLANKAQDATEYVGYGATHG